MTNPTTDLAARFEAKREECWKLAAIGEGRSGVDFWAGGASAFAEARDMARAGAAGGAELRAAAVRVLTSSGFTGPESDAASDSGLNRTLQARHLQFIAIGRQSEATVKNDINSHV